MGARRCTGTEMETKLKCVQEKSRDRDVDKAETEDTGIRKRQRGDGEREGGRHVGREGTGMRCGRKQGLRWRSGERGDKTGQGQ